MSGSDDVNRDGAAMINDPDLGFSELRKFGPALVNHTQLKIRANIKIKKFMIIDSPGMIDSPKRKETKGNGNIDLSYNSNDRGYDFEGVARWYAEHADIILLFFDPDKPGTTGETLTILTNSLVQMDSKVYIILNKVDQFLKIHDFARAYGTLCWNLSKVLSRKDLPRIYTTYLPMHAQNNVPTLDNIYIVKVGELESSLGPLLKSEEVSDSHSPSAMRLSSRGIGLSDFDVQR